jgi:hypothetical protein
MAQLRLTETTANTIRDRYQTLFANAFTPNIRYEQMRRRTNVPPMRWNMPRIGSDRSTRNWGAS